MLIVVIILIAIGVLIFDLNARTKNEDQLIEAAKNARETKKIINYIRNASTAKVNRVECRLSVYKPIDYPGCETIALNITLHDSELAHIYAEAKDRIRSARENVKCPQDMLALDNRIQNETQHIYKAISSYFPSISDADFLKKFAVMDDSSIIISANSITVPIYCTSGNLGIENGKGPYRSPYVIDAVAEVVKTEIPNVVFSIDKTIPVKNS